MSTGNGDAAEDRGVDESARGRPQPGQDCAATYSKIVSLALLLRVAPGHFVRAVIQEDGQRVLRVSALRDVLGAPGRPGVPSDQDQAVEAIVRRNAWPQRKACPHFPALSMILAGALPRGHR